MSKQQPASFRLGAVYLAALDRIATRRGLAGRTAAIRRLIDDALADEREGMPSAGQIAQVVDRLTAAMRAEE